MQASIPTRAVPSSYPDPGIETIATDKASPAGKHFPGHSRCCQWDRGSWRVATGLLWPPPRCSRVWAQATMGLHNWGVCHGRNQRFTGRADA